MEGGISLFSVDQRNDCNDEFKRVSWASRRVKSEVSRDFCIPAHHLSFHNSKTLLFIHIGRHLETSGLKRCLIYDSACNTHSHLVLTGGSSFSQQNGIFTSIKGYSNTELGKPCSSLSWPFTVCNRDHQCTAFTGDIK